MSRCSRLAVGLLGLALACAGQHRLAAVQRLGDAERELYSKYRQFMTEGQQDEFLALPGEQARREYVAALKVEERLSRYPQRIQDAIWAQDVVEGMDREAVLLTWSTPMLREWDQEEAARGNEVERWTYRRSDGYVQIVVSNGVVTRVLVLEGQR